MVHKLVTLFILFGTVAATPKVMAQIRRLPIKEAFRYKCKVEYSQSWTTKTPNGSEQFVAREAGVSFEIAKHANDQNTVFTHQIMANDWLADMMGHGLPDDLVGVSVTLSASADSPSVISLFVSAPNGQQMLTVGTSGLLHGASIEAYAMTEPVDQSPEQKALELRASCLRNN